MAAKGMKEVPGNAMESAQRHAEMIYNIGVSMLDLQRAVEHFDDDERELVAIRLKTPGCPNVEVLVVVSCNTKEGRKVAFSSGSDLIAALKTLGARLKNGSLKWKDDQYAN